MAYPPTIYERIAAHGGGRSVKPLLDVIFQTFRPKVLFIAAGSTYAMKATDTRKIVNLDTLAGSTVTLPASTGSQNLYRFRVSVLATSNSHIIKVANTSDAMEGSILTRDDTADACMAFFAVAGTSDTITLNRSTTGSVTIGEYIEIEDIAPNRFRVYGRVSNTGTPATQFSATV